MTTRSGAFRAGDAGTTLAELLVTMVLLGVVGTISSTLLISGQRAASATASRVQVTGSTRQAMDTVTRTLRTAVRPNSAPATTAFVSAGSSSVTFYANNLPGNGPTLVTYAVDAAGQLTETSTSATTTSGAYEWTTASPRTRVLLRGLPPSAGVLRFYDAQTLCTDGCLIPVSGSPAVVAPAALSTIRMVEVTLAVSDPGRPRSTPVGLSSRVGVMRNASPLAAP